jgi:hypothetical protein
MPTLYPNQWYTSLETVQALAADLSVVNRMIRSGNPLTDVCLYPSITKATITAPVTEVLQVTTITPAAVASTAYGITIAQYDYATGNDIVKQYYYETAASGDTATTIGDAFRSQINADPTIKVAATGTTTLILTAETGYAQFRVIKTGSTVGNTSLAVVATTAGVVAIGTQAALARQGITLPSATYTQIHIEYNQNSGLNLKDQVTLASVWDLYISQGATNRAALVTAWTEILGNLIKGGTDASIENFAVV